MKTIGIVGSRRRDTAEDLELTRKEFLAIYEKGDTLVSGGCPLGADHMAEIFAKEYGIPIKIHYAEWDKYGRGAGFQRNKYIAEDADVLIACVSPDRKGGTEDTIKKSLALHKTIFLVPQPKPEVEEKKEPDSESWIFDAQGT